MTVKTISPIKQEGTVHLKRIMIGSVYELFKSQNIFLKSHEYLNVFVLYAYRHRYLYAGVFGDIENGLKYVIARYIMFC